MFKIMWAHVGKKERGMVYVWNESQCRSEGAKPENAVIKSTAVENSSGLLTVRGGVRIAEFDFNTH